MMKKFLATLAVAGLASPAFAATKGDVLSHYADLAQAKYQDSLTAARDLQKAVDALVVKPTQANLAAARAAWTASRVPYQQSEVYRFGNAIVDDWEGKVNAWPLDEGLIDYVASSYGAESDENPGYRANVIANRSFPFSGKGEAFAAADMNKDGKIDLKTEMTFGPAYYAAGFDASVYDKGNKTAYLHTIAKAFLDGRKLLTSARGEKLTDAQRASLMGHAATIADNWEKVLAEATFKYAGSVYKDMAKLKTIVDAKGDPAKAFRAYAKHWGELKGFSLALQAGKNNLGETATRLNRMIGAGPLLLNASQVADIDSKGNYVRDQGPAWGEYMLHMAKVQTLLVEKFGVKARNNDVTGEMRALSDTLGGKASAEND